MPTAATVPDVSFVVIAHNERQHAPITARSILEQSTTAAFEVIFVDDGSTDGTAEAVATATAGDERLRLLRLSENRGRGAARAAGVGAARAPAVAFVDADITLPDDWLDRCLEELPGNAAVGGIAVPDGDSTVVARLSGATPRPVGGSAAITGNNVLFDATILAEIGFDPRDRLGEDFRLANRLVRAGHSLRRVPGLTVRHEESKDYVVALRWRFANGIDASSHPRAIGRLRLADLVWGGFLASWAVALAGSALRSPRWLVVGLLGSVAPGLVHAASRFRARPVGRFLLACLVDVPLVIAYLAGRTVGIPRLLRDHR